MPIPSLTRKQSSLSAIIEQERSLSGASRDSQLRETEPEEAPAEEQRQVKSTVVQDEGGDTDNEGGDTDIEEEPPALLAPTLSKQKTVSIKEVKKDGPPLRMSRRLMSMKRKGKVVLLRELSYEFEFNAGDVVTVRGEEDDFYVCRVLEDVPHTAKSFRVAWFNRVAPNLYELSFDDVCDMMSVITRVSLVEREDGKVSLLKKYIRQTKKLLREALAAERGEEIEDERDEAEDQEEDEEEDLEEEEPPAKRTRSSDHISFTPPTRKGKRGKGKTASPKKAVTPKKAKAQKQKPASPKKKAEPKNKPRRTGVLIPNPEIELLKEDPTFDTSQDWGLMPCKFSIRATLRNDMEELKSCIENVKKVHTPHWPRSPDVGMFAIHYALLKNDKEAVDLLVDDLIEPKANRCKKPNITLNPMDTGSYNFHTFGHPVREIYASRGSREGNNAFLHDQNKSKTPFQLLNSLVDYCFQTPEVPLEMVEYLVEKLVKKSKMKLNHGIQKVWKAIRCGNRKVAGYFVKKAIEKEGFGFNFLHKEVLVNDKEPLTKFRSQSVKKKPYENKCILPIHAACINPNGQYLKQLLESVPEYNFPDKEGYKPVHYASACEGPEPLNILLSRGIDPNDLAPQNLTPIMIAAQYGRDECIEAVMSKEESAGTDLIEEEDEEAPQPRVKINAKSRSTESAIHYAANNGHTSTIRVLVKHGANINLQTGSGKGNVTPLMIAAMLGNLDMVKTCVELGGGADKRGKWRMTPLMYAVKNGHSMVAAYLLRLGVDPNASDTSGNTPVHYAAAYGWLHCLQLLIKAGANPNVSNQWKTTPLALSMLKDHIKCTEYLLSLESCDVNVPNDDGQTLLSETLGKLKMDNTMLSRVKYLVDKKGADVKTTDIKDWTPLHYLAANSIYKSPGSIPKTQWLNIPEDVGPETAPVPANEISQKDQEPEDADDGDDKMEDDDEVKDDDDKMEDDDAANNDGDAADDAEDNDDTANNDAANDAAANDDAANDDADYDAADSDAAADDDDYSDAGSVPFDDDSDSDDSSYRFQNKAVPYTARVSPPPQLLNVRAKASCDIADVLYKAGADLDAVDENGQTPMMIAILQFNYPLVNKLIKLGAKVYAGKNKEGRQIIHLLAKQKKELDLRELYSDETEPPLSGTIDEQMKQRSNYLDKLVTRANTDMLMVCIDAGAELSASDNDGLTPLMVALEYDNIEMFEILLDNKADPSIGLANTGENILHKLSALGWKSKAPELLKKVAAMLDKSTRIELARTVDNSGFTPLLQACEALVVQSRPKDWNGVNVLEVLIEDFGADPTARVGKIKRGEKVRRRSPSNLGLTINRKPGEVEDDDEYGVTGKFSCVHFLAYYSGSYGDQENTLVDMVLDKLPSSNEIINSRDRHGSTPLHLAVSWDKKITIESLVRKGADINLLCEDERHLFGSPLIMACRPTLQYDVTRCLLQLKANPNLVDKDGRSALSHAVNDKPGSLDNRLEAIQALLEAGAQVNSADHKARSVLHYAVNGTTGGLEAMTDIEDLLLKYGANTTARDCRGRLPLHYAFVKIGQHTDSSLSDPISISSLLIEAMAEQNQDMKALINHADNYGQTPLHRAAIRGSTLCVLGLVKRGARLDMEDKNGNTPLSLAIRENHNSCAMVLVQMNAPPNCTVTSPVTPKQIEEYEKEKKRTKWMWKELSDLQVPKPVITSAFQAVVVKSWQGIAYLMLEEAGLNFIVALRAVLGARKVDLAWTLLKKQKKDVFVQGVDDKGRNILHFLALHTTAKENDFVIQKIAVHLLERGVSPSSLDKEGAIPLHYAACNGNEKLCKLLLRYNPSTINTVHPSGMTPLACVFDCTTTSSRYYFINEIFTQAKPKTLDVCYKVGGLDDLKQDTTTPLIEACFENDEHLVNLLLENGASVNFAKGNGRTPLMEVVRANMEDMAKLLLYGTKDRAQWKGNNTNINMSATDNEGKGAIHHCIQSREYGSYENVTMLLLLAKFGAPLEVPDNSGKTPLQYTLLQQSGKMREALMDLIEDKSESQDGVESMEIDQELGFQFTSTIDAYWEGPEPDVDADSEAMLAEAKPNDEKPDDEEPDYDPNKPPVDAEANIENGEVYIDPTTGIPYDILMSKVDVKYGMFGLNNFYKMQVIYHKGKGLWVLLNRWGRIGDCGQHQRTPFRDPNEATNEFRRIFRSKTGNHWEDKDSFEKKPKKYALVLPERNPEFKHKKAAEILKPFDLDKCPPSRLPKELQQFIKQITDVDFLKNFLKNIESLSFDEDYMPFGRLSTETINKARDILLEIKKIVSGIDMDNMAKEQPKFEQIADLSNSYFMLIPVAHYAFESIVPLNSVQDVDKHLNAITVLTELAYTSKLLLAAQYRAKEINPLDYCYRSFGSHIELIDCESEECQLILKYIHNSNTEGSRAREQLSVEAVYRISRPEEKTCMTSCGVQSNRRLLWHGTKTANLISILKQGLRIAPPEAPTSGWSLGKGIYFSDSLDKSLGYSDLHGYSYYDTRGFALLCEVALGTQHEHVYDYRSSDVITGPPTGSDSMWLVTSRIPDPSHNVTTPYGAVIPSGPHNENTPIVEKYNQMKKRLPAISNEYVVYNEAQVQQRYIVQFYKKKSNSSRW